MDNRSKQVLTHQRGLMTTAWGRWQGFQQHGPTLAGAVTNRDGSIPLPRVAAVTPEQRARFENRQKLRERFDNPDFRETRMRLERRIGATLDFSSLPPNEQALKAGRPVVRIVTLPGPGHEPEAFASGFLVAPGLLITNQHVFRTADEAEGVGAQFLYERTQGGIRQGLTFALEPKRFFVNDRKLDYAVVAVKSSAVDGAPLSQFQFLPLIASKGKIRKGDPVNIIQHPDGQPKQYATVNNNLLDLRDDGFLLYETDTLAGSSGSPVFNQYWETIGLHRCGVPRIEEGQLVTKDGRRWPMNAEVADDDLEWVGNEGTRVSAIVDSLRQKRPAEEGQRQLLAQLLELTVDPLLIVTEKSPLVTAANQPLMEAKEAMAQNLFQFSGPVTIHVGGPQSGTGTEVRVGPSAPAGTTEAPLEEFREKKLKFDENYSKRTNQGYNADFLPGWKVPTPSVAGAQSDALLKDDAGEVMEIPYYHYSLVMNRERRLLHWAASNVDFSQASRKFTKSRKEYGGEDWRLDPRVALAAPGLQIENAHFYAPARKIDRGHIVRREDACWGATAREAEYGNSDTYHWTNCTPQSEAFNQSKLDGIWGQFEDHIKNQIVPMDGRMTLFAGPVFNESDPEHGYEDQEPIRVPMEFWKVVLCVERAGGGDTPLAYGFIFDQTEAVRRLGFERMNMDDYETFQVPIREITAKTGVVFDQSVLDADVMKNGGHTESVRGVKAKRLHTVDAVILR